MAKEKVITIKPLVDEKELDRVPPGKVVAIDIRTRRVIAYADTLDELLRVMDEKGYKGDEYIL